MDELVILYEQILSNPLPPVEEVFDNKSGMGQVPYGQDIDYFGFIVPMSYKKFRSLVLPGNWDRRTIDVAANHIKSGGKIGNPFLMAKWNSDTKKWKVLDHEGRSRSDALAKLYGEDVIIPIHIFPSGMRARHITDEMRNAPFISQADEEN